MSWLPKQTVVVPTDFSPESFDAVETALTLVDRPEHLHVIHVLPVLQVTEPGVVWDVIDDEGRREHAAAALRVRYSGPKYQGLNVVVEVGDPGHEVTEYAQKKHADLIVLPSHGRTGIKHLLLGSIAEKVVRLAECPVLTVSGKVH